MLRVLLWAVYGKKPNKTGVASGRAARRARRALIARGLRRGGVGVRWEKGNNQWHSFTYLINYHTVLLSVPSGAAICDYSLLYGFSVLLCVVHTRPTLDDMGGFREPRERVLTHSHSPPPPWCLSSVFVGVRVDPESPRPPSALSRLCLENRLVVKVFRAGWVVGTMFRV